MKSDSMNEETRQPITVEKLVYGGHGLLRNLNGQIVFAEDVIPGEQIDVHTTEKRRGVLWADRFERVTSSPDRVTDRCPNQDACGGCQLLFMSEKRERQEKELVFDDVMRRSGIQNTYDTVFHDFKFTASRYRGTMHFKDGLLGFFERGSHRIVPFSQCRVIPDSVSDVLPSLVSLLRKMKNPDNPMTGDLYFVVSPANERVLLELSVNGKARHDMKPHLKDWARKQESLSGLVLTFGNGKSYSLFGRATQLFRWKKHHPLMTPRSFFQSNPASWPVFWDQVNAWRGEFHQASPRIWDVHAGSGFLSSGLQGCELIGTEPNREAYGNLCRLNKGEHSLTGDDRIGEFHRFTAEKYLKSMDSVQLDGMIIDPPRGGLSKKLRQWILEHGPEKLLSISCDWGTLSRDLSELLKVYRFSGPFHLLNVNPGTFRMETLVFLERQPTIIGH